MSALRLVISVVVVLLLLRALRVAWVNRELGVAVWRRIRWRHVLGSAGLLVLVVGIFFGLVTLVPFTRFGLGSLVGFDGNAVFAPVEEVAVRTTGTGFVEGGGVGTPFWVDAAILTFLALLVGLLPWLAFGEERMFRLGLERASAGRQVWAALRFGLVHLIMLIPLAAALAVGVAGYFYGRAYRSAYARAIARQPVPVKVVDLDGVDPSVAAELAAVEERRSIFEARREALLASTVWHTTFNTLIVALVVVGVVTGV